MFQRIYHWFKIYWKDIVVICIIYSLILFLSSFAPIRFADAYNAVTAENVAHSGKYISPLGDEFDVFLSTGPAVILPIAFSFVLFGSSVLAIRAVMVAYTVAFFVLWFLLMGQWFPAWGKIKKYLVLIFSGFLLLKVNILGGDIFYNVLGQMPGFFYLFLAFYLLTKYQRRPSLLLVIFAAISIGLAIQSKLFFVLAVPSLFYLLFVRANGKWQSWKKWIGHSSIAIIFALLPTILFLVWQWCALGTDQFLRTQYALYKTMKYVPDSLIQISAVNLMKQHVHTLEQMLHVDWYIFIIFLLSVFVGVYYAWRKNVYTIVALSIFLFLYSGWWFFRDTGNRDRHTLYLLLPFVVLCVWQWCSRGMWRVGRTLALLSITIILIRGVHLHSVLVEEPIATLYAQQQLVDYWNNTMSQQNISVVYAGLDVPADIAFLVHRPTWNSVRDMDMVERESGNIHYHMLTPIGHDYDPFVYHYTLDNHCIQPLLYNAGNYSICTAYNNSYSEEEYQYMLQRKETICEELKQGYLGSCAKQIGDGFIITLSDFLTLGKDFAAWIKMKPGAHTLILDGKMLHGIPHQNMHIFINDQLVSEYAGDEEEYFRISIDLDTYQQGELIKVRIVNDEVFSPIYSWQFFNVHYDQRSIELYNIVQE
ncbi:MAG: hypothetical protein HYV32_00820 [Candidatus Kerfeldbacteria bacterium]|nr:hypothetical protein [Candidatus Kerfeldbacteria bacterium]